MKQNMSSAAPGCVFEHCGKIPEGVYKPETYNSPLEEAVCTNNTQLFSQLVQEGHPVSVKLKEGYPVSVKLKVGQMSCIEYSAMKGHVEMLKLLLEHSVNADTLKQYFSLDDVVDRAYLISRNKQIFFQQEALAESNRYVAALFTAIEYDRPQCVQVMLLHLSSAELHRQAFYTNGANPKRLNACELAHARGHLDCYKLLRSRQEQQAS